MSNNYTGLRWNFKDTPQARQRCAERLLAMRKSLTPLRQKKSDGSLLLATWNIRDFDSNKFGFGPRLPETFYYLAEIISSFDLVALQEVNYDLEALEALMKILGYEWDYIVTDVTEGPGGNYERMAFVFNKEKVQFRKIAGEIVLPEGQMVVSQKTLTLPKDETGTPGEKVTKDVEQQFARTPFLVAFQSGWFRFSLCTVHIYYGAASGKSMERRIGEIERLVEFFAKRQDKEAEKVAKAKPDRVENYILLGDFNVVSPEHKTMQALKSNGFEVPAAIDGKKVRKEGQHFYDQIATRVKDERFKVVEGGIVDMFADVFRDTDDDRQIYASTVKAALAKGKDDGPPPANPEAAYRKWRTWQMSDHAPLWVRIETDFSDQYLGDIAKEE